MSALKNPYLSFDSQNLLLRKNYKVIQSSSKETLFPSYEPNRQKLYNYKETQYNKNHQFTISTKGFSSSLNLRNPFSTKALGERNQNYPQSLSNIPSFHTQPYLPSVQRKQLPFPSYNRPQYNNRPGSSFSSSKVTNILSLSRRNLAVSNIKISSTQSLQKNIPLTTTPYRPHFISPTSRTMNNEWNTQKWKHQLQTKERQKLSKYGPQSLRYDGQLVSGINKINAQNNNLDMNFNNQYYSTSSLQQQLYKITIQKPPRHHELSKGKNVVLFDYEQQQRQHQQSSQSQVKGYFRYNNNNNNNQYEKNKYQATNSKNNYNQSSSPSQSLSSDSLFIPNNRRRQTNINMNVNKFSDIKQQSYMSKIYQSKMIIKPHKNHNNNINVDFINDDVDDNFGNPQQQFMSKYSQRYSNNIYQNQRQYNNKNKGPLDLDAFDSVYNQNNNNKQQEQEQGKQHRQQQDSEFSLIRNKTEIRKDNSLSSSPIVIGRKDGKVEKEINKNINSKVEKEINKKNYNNFYNNNKQLSKNTLSRINNHVRVENNNMINNSNDNTINSREYPRQLQYKNKLYYLIKFN